MTQEPHRDALATRRAVLAGAGRAANVLGSTSEVPVGGGMIFAAKKVGHPAERG